MESEKLGTFEVVGKGTFLEGLQFLKNKDCEAIFGPQGGIIVLDEDDGVVYRTPPKGFKGIYFSTTSYFGTWKFLKGEFWHLSEYERPKKPELKRMRRIQI